METPKQTPWREGKERVLVVENIARVRDDIIENLRIWGYEPIVAAGYGAALLSDAEDKARSHRCHLALIDMRLTNDRSRYDTSGLRLIKKIAPTTVIILSGFGDRETVRAALKEWGAHDFVGKEDGPEKLREILQETLGSIWRRPDTVQKIVWTCDDGTNSAVLIRRFFANDQAVPLDEVNDVLRRLFPKANSLWVETIRREKRTSSLSLRSRSVILRVKTDERDQPYVVKIGRSERVQREVENYHQWVEKHRLGLYFARLEASVNLWDIGGTKYDLLSDAAQVPPLFTEYYGQEQNPTAISEVLGRFLEQWHPYYRVQREKRPTSLFEAYTSVWGDEWKARITTADFSRSLPSPFNTWGLPNPIAWLQERGGLGSDGAEDGSMDDVWFAIAHGDLQGDNFFVDNHKNIWIIDFERTGIGPILQDFTELETDILTRLADYKPDALDEFARLVCAILMPKTRRPKARSFSLPESNKAFTAIKKIRELAQTSTGSSEQTTLLFDVRQYFWGLLLNVDFRLTFWEEKGVVPPFRDEVSGVIRTSEYIRCWLLGSLICHRLQHWSDEQWPPDEWGLSGNIPDLSSDSSPQLSYNTTTIRGLLVRSFNDDEVTIFCFDHFQSVYKEFTTGMSKPQKVHRLIEHCANHGQFDVLLRLVEAHDPHQYNLIRDRLLNAS